MGSQCLGRGCNRTLDAHTGRLQPGNRVFDPKLFDALPSLKLAAVLIAGQLKIPPANIPTSSETNFHIKLCHHIYRVYEVAQCSN